MAKVIVLGCACVVISELTPEEIERHSRYDLARLDETGDPQPAGFTIDLDDGPGHLDESGAVFSRTKSADGRATLTIILDPEEEDKVKMVQEHMGTALLRLRKAEEEILRGLDEAAEAEKKMVDMFTQV